MTISNKIERRRVDTDCFHVYPTPGGEREAVTGETESPRLPVLVRRDASAMRTPRAPLGSTTSL
eukprot:3328369-Prymnesium_polylepis.1